MMDNYHEYIDGIYDTIDVLNEKKSVILAKNKIDGRLAVVKFVKSYDRNVYEVLKSLKLPGIPEIYEIISTPGELLVVEEYLDGVTLDEYMSSNSLDKENEVEIISITEQLCYILSALHSLKPPIIHRDIKPDNIMIDKDGRAYIIDFNISRHYKGNVDRDTINMGTDGFAAPEQFGFGESSNKTDIYGLGATIKYISEKYGIRSERIESFSAICMEMSPDDRFSDAISAWYYLRDFKSTGGLDESAYMERKLKPGRVLPLMVTCGKCHGETQVDSYRTFVKCQDCSNEIAFRGFDYSVIDWGSSMYSSIEYWTDCPVCRSPNMYLGAEQKAWKCPDCLYKMTAEEKDKSIFWFCDECESFLNIQSGFTENPTKTWTCTSCSYTNDISENNII